MNTLDDISIARHDEQLSDAIVFVDLTLATWLIKTLRSVLGTDARANLEQ